MDSGRSHETPGSETMDFITHRTASSTSISKFLPLLPCPTGIMGMDPGGYVTEEGS